MAMNCKLHEAKSFVQTDLAVLEEDNLLSSSPADGRNNHDEDDAGFFRIPPDPDLEYIFYNALMSDRQPST